MAVHLPFKNRKSRLCFLIGERTFGIGEWLHPEIRDIICSLWKGHIIYADKRRFIAKTSLRKAIYFFVEHGNVIRHRYSYDNDVLAPVEARLSRDEQAKGHPSDITVVIAPPAGRKRFWRQRSLPSRANDSGSGAKITGNGQPMVGGRYSSPFGACSLPKSP